jgi:transposase InsO family protein
MLDTTSFVQLLEQLNLSQAARVVVEQIRYSNPSRRVQGGRRNVSGSYPSKKMGVTIQFESHRNELARIYELEHDPDVLEYYDQPPSIELVYQAKSGRQNRHQYTPDFFVIRTTSAGWEECKTEQDLIRLSQDSPNRFLRGEDDRWHCPPAESYANRFGFYFRLWSSAEISWIFQQNFIWLEDYLRSDSLIVDEIVAKTVLSRVEAQKVITLADLLQSSWQATPDDIYALIATQQLYVDLNAARLSEPEKVRVFLSREVAFAYKLSTEITASSLPTSFQSIQITVGASLLWDGEYWEVANTGATTTGLLRSDGKFVELLNSVFDDLIHKGRITALSQPEEPSRSTEVEAILRHASPGDIEEANRRYEVIQPYLNKSSPTCPTRTIRRWRNSYWNAEDTYGNGYVGLLPSHGVKGNRAQKVDETAREFMTKFIKENYENLKQRSVIRVYEAFVQACDSHEPKLNPPSRITFSRAIKQRSGYTQTKKREGRRAAIEKEEFYWELELTTPRHGTRPFEIVHVDHTQLDVELVSSLTSLSNCNLNVINDSTSYNLGRPWATFMVDAYSRRLLAVYITYEEPSYRSCMMVLRICVQRFKRLPQTIVVDNGSEFHSHYFEQLLAHYACTKKHRPPATARFGSVVERLFGTANTQFIYELQGNTQIMRQHRQVTRSVSPDKLAVWTLGDLYEALCEWAYEIYDKREHPALGQSPRDAFANGLAIGGSRLHRRVEYDQTFQILTLPAPEQGKRKVQPSHGVKIHNIYYWSNAFRNPEIEKTLVDVRYDPFDAGVAYAFVRGQWVKCISNHYQYLQGRTEKEIKLISTELNRRKQAHGRRSIHTDKELVQFLKSIELKEGKLLKQRLQAAENRSVLHVIEGRLSDKNEQPRQSQRDELKLGAIFSAEPESIHFEKVEEIEEDLELDDLEFYAEF